MGKAKEKTTSGEIVPVQTDNQSLTPTQNNFNPEALIAKAIENNLPVETMERLLAMRKELKAEWAKEQFDKAMAKFQSECPTIVKTKEVKTRSGAVAYKYAPIDSIIEQVKVPLKDNGFSYSTKQELLETGVKISVTVTHSSGHSETTSMEVPFGNKTDIMSQSQVVAAASTFAKRYAFCNALGIMTGDEDNDGQTENLSDKKEQKPAPKPMTAKQVDHLLCSKHGATLLQYPAGVKNNKAYESFISCSKKDDAGNWCKAYFVNLDHQRVLKNPETGKFEVVMQDYPDGEAAQDAINGEIVIGKDTPE